jgi:hypothetical protein
MKIMLPVYFLFIFNISQASRFSPLILSDTTKPNEYVSLNRKEFLAKYGKDDSSRALINYFFHKRTNGKVGIFTNATFFSFFAVGSIAAASDHSQSGDISSFIGFIFYSFLAMTATVLVFAIALLRKHSRKKLLDELENYKAGGPFPRSIARTHLYKKLLKQEKK